MQETFPKALLFVVGLPSLSLYIFYVDHFLKVFISVVTLLFLFYVLIFWPLGMWDVSSLTRDWTTAPALEDKVLTTGSPRKSLYIF